MDTIMSFAGKLQLPLSQFPPEPKPRLRHYADARPYRLGGAETFILAGRTVTDKSIPEERLSSTIQVFDHYREQWKLKEPLKTTGSPPKGLYDGGCCVSPSGDLYVYGGCDGSAARGGLYKLQLSSDSLKWSQLSGESDKNSPAERMGCRMVCFGKKNVAVAGGYAPAPAAQLQPGGGVSLISTNNKCSNVGKNSEIYIFDINERTWSSPAFSGANPPPTGGFTLTSIDEYRAIMFGGKEYEELKRVNNLYLIDFQALVITKLSARDGDPWPVGRVAHAACCLGFGSQHPHLLVTGGLDNDNNTLGDAWLFDVTNKRWMQLEMPKSADINVLSRYGHTLAAISLAPGLIEVNVFGGASQYRPDKYVQSMAATAIMTFKYSKSTCTWHLTDVAKIVELGSTERIQKKIERIKRHARKAQMPTDDGNRDALDASQMLEKDVLEGATCNERNTDTPMRDCKQFQQEYEELQQECQHLKQQQQEIQQKFETAEERAREAEAQHQQKQQQLQQEYQELQQQHQQECQKSQYAEVRAREAEAQLHQVQSHWIIPKSEIEPSEEMLGQGAWGKVKVAMFRGTRVAAKCFHQILLSEHNLRLFRREISMAARLRHPNLVQFIGASIEGELILVTELMTTSLGALMHRGALSEASITSISLNVAQALNYLHLMQPHPIIHRDICSFNVLLDPLPEDCWKAKVSDYGSVNLLQHLTTAHPGNPFYAAPESEYPRLQTPKMDIYSFGVLLAEMLTNELPEKKDRHRQILKISVERPNFIELVRQCLSEEGYCRPSAQDIITRLSDM